LLHKLWFFFVFYLFFFFFPFISLFWKSIKFLDDFLRFSYFLIHIHSLMMITSQFISTMWYHSISLLNHSSINIESIKSSLRVLYIDHNLPYYRNAFLNPQYRSFIFIIFSLYPKLFLSYLIHQLFI
jgi:hypothetical protein